MILQAIIGNLCAQAYNMYRFFDTTSIANDGEIKN